MTRFTIVLSDLCSARLEEMAYPSETASKTAARLINGVWNRRRDAAQNGASATDHASAIDAKRQEYFDRVGRWPEEAG